MRRLIFLLLLAPLQGWANIDDLTPTGSGQLRWFLMDIYRATLYTPDGKYIEDGYPKALKIDYQRNIPARRLVETTEKEWQRLKVDYDPNWLQQLEQLWPDIAAGDKLTVRAANPNLAVFYFNGQRLGEIKSSNFAKAFLSIWLSPNSRDKTLRANLTGDNHG